VEPPDGLPATSTVANLHHLRQVGVALKETAHGAVDRISAGGDPHPRQRHQLRDAEGHGQPRVVLELQPDAVDEGLSEGGGGGT